MNAPTPNLPALIDALPSDSTRAPQTQFDRARQAIFLEALATRGSVRQAVVKAQVSHQSAYRARRACRAFKRAWDAALVVARGRAEAVLADRAIEGVEEQVFYHGEVVATRRRFDSRLLLAHLARLDKLADADGDAAALAEDFDGMLERFAAGEELRVPAKAGTSGLGAQPRKAPAFAGDQVHGDQAPNYFPQDSVTGGPCLAPDEGDHPPVEAPPCEDCGGLCDTPYAELGPDDCQYLENRLARMDAARPEEAETPYRLASALRGPGIPPLEQDVDRIEALQLEAFEADGHEWWLVTSDEQMTDSIIAANPMTEEERAELEGAGDLPRRRESREEPGDGISNPLPGRAMAGAEQNRSER